jgi:hypothetical protein
MVDIMVAVALQDEAIAAAGEAIPDVRDSAAGMVTVFPAADELLVEAAVADAALVAVVVPMAAEAASEADNHFMAAVGTPSTAADIALVVVDTASVVAGTAPTEAVMVGGAGNFRHQFEVLAADGKCCRPLCFGHIDVDQACGLSDNERALPPRIV